MILKENYFDDIEITDDDLKYPIDDFNTFNTDETYANPKEWFNSMKSEYTHCMSFDIDYADILTQDKIWNHDVPRLLKNIQYILDVYEVRYSTAMVQEIQHSAGYERYKFIDFYGYKLITKYNDLTTLNDNNPYIKIGAINMLMFFNLPKIHTYLAACRFIGNIVKQLWKNRNHNSYLKKLIIQDRSLMGRIYEGLHLYSPYAYRGVEHTVYKDLVHPDDTVTGIIQMFFPEKDEDTIYDELSSDRELLSRLYKCFPD
jgi:hypothetical protein